MYTQGQCIDPVPILKSASAAIAPFQLPPQATRVDNFWTFLESPCASPALPAVGMQIYARDTWPLLLAGLRAVVPQETATLPDQLTDINATMLQLRELFKQKPELRVHLERWLRDRPGPPLNATDARLLKAMLNIYSVSTADARLLNFVGPALTIPTYAFADVYSAQPGTSVWTSLQQAVAGKAVFIGASEVDIEEQKNTADAFSTVFDDNSGMRLQGVEIAATAFVNLFYDNALRRLPSRYSLLIIAIHSLFLAWIWSRFDLRQAALISGLTLAAYVLTATWLFERFAWWLPLIIPCGQALIGASLAWLARYLEAARERLDLVRAVRKRLPPAVMRDYVITGQIRHTIHGVCLASDVGDWTRLASQLSEEMLSDLMRAYFTPLFSAVEHNQGYIVDTAGDGMLAIWVQEEVTPEQRRERACLGALEIARAVTAFNARSPHELRTRLGLHWGKLVLRDIGDIDEFALKAFGLAVNTASRIENLNKWLHTSILASADTTTGLKQFLWRPVGAFMLEGLIAPIDLFELIGLKTEASTNQLQLCTTFANAMACYRDRAFSQARQCLLEILVLDPDDGPAHFYLDMIAKFADAPPTGAWSGAITAPKTGPVSARHPTAVHGPTDE
jgi:adenylate cyclase